MVASREIAYCGMFGAAALLLPSVFHLLHLGHLFMPMYLPLVTLAFFVRPLPAALTACVTPLLSGALTGMPPFYPPFAFVMAVELAFMAGLAATARQAAPRLHTLAILLPVLLLGRACNVALIYLAAQVVRLPAAFVAGASLLSGWPGVVLMVVAVPAIVTLADRVRRPRTGGI